LAELFGGCQNRHDGGMSPRRSLSNESCVSHNKSEMSYDSSRGRVWIGPVWVRPDARPGTCLIGKESKMLSNMGAMWMHPPIYCS